jgi:hypothetical protein
MVVQSDVLSPLPIGMALPSIGSDRVFFIFEYYSYLWFNRNGFHSNDNTALPMSSNGQFLEQKYN